MIEITTSDRQRASDIIKTLRKTFTRSSLAKQLMLNPSYISFILYQTKDYSDRPIAPPYAIRAVLEFADK